MNTQYLDTTAAFALRVTQFSDRLYAQMADAMQVRGLNLATKTMGIVQFLYSEGPHSQAEISQRLRYSHQLTAQRLRWLYQHDFAKSQPDPKDGRRSLVELTAAGRSEGEKLQQFLPLLIEAYEHLFSELSADLDGLIQKADGALQETTLSDRMAAELAAG